MPRDGENLFRRKGDRFWSFKYKGLDGMWHEESTGKELKSNARDVRNDNLARYRAGQTPNDMSGWMLKRAVEEHLALRKVQAPKSVRLETTCFNAVVEVFGEDKRLNKITNLDLEQYQVYRLGMKKKKGQGPIQPSTVNLEIQYLAQLLRRAKLWSRLEDDYKPLRESKNGIGRAITEQQFIKLLKTAKDNPAWLVPFCAAVISACSGGHRGFEIKKVEAREYSAEQARSLDYDSS